MHNKSNTHINLQQGTLLSASGLLTSITILPFLISILCLHKSQHILSSLISPLLVLAPHITQSLSSLPGLTNSVSWFFSMHAQHCGFPSLKSDCTSDSAHIPHILSSPFTWQLCMQPCSLGWVNISHGITIRSFSSPYQPPLQPHLLIESARGTSGHAVTTLHSHENSVLDPNVSLEWLPLPLAVSIGICAVLLLPNVSLKWVPLPPAVSTRIYFAQLLPL